MGFDYTCLASGKFELPDAWQVGMVQDVAVVNEQSIQKGYKHERIEYIDIASVEKGTIKSIQTLSLKKAPSRARRIVKDKDILIATVRPNLEHYVFIKEASPNTIASTGFAVITAKQVEPRYLYYYLTTTPFTEYLTRIADSHTSAYPAFNPDVIEKTELLLPPDPEQRAIAHILGSLDDKIELNRRMNRTLEKMAAAIFKSWFIDFDPVRAKAEGRQPPGLAPHIADLFPDDFEDSDLGEIPKGWRIVKAEELFNISSDTVSPKKFPNEIFDHYSIPAFDTGRWPKVETGNEIKSNKNLVIDGAVLISKLNPRIPRVWLPILRSEHRAIASTEFLVVLPRDVVTREYLYSLFSSRAFMDVFATLVTGTSGSHQRVKPEYLLNMKVVVPPAPLIDQFSTLTNPMLLKVAQNLKESQTLAAIRDALLPKLISGEIRVKEAEKVVEATA